MAIAIVLSAGSGKRMGTKKPKQYLKLKGKEILYYSLQTFQNHKDIEEIILVTGENDVSFCKNNIIDYYGLTKVKSICIGGAERYHSVYNGLVCLKERMSEYSGVVMIHDGARPFITEEMIEHSIEMAAKTGACTVGVPVKDTIKIIDSENNAVSTPERSNVYQIQTPQTFLFEKLLAAYNKMFMLEKQGKVERVVTDDTMVAELYGGLTTKVIPGDYDNIKITTPEDVFIAEKIIEKNSKKVLTIET